jgi:hypothetical protein
VVEKNRFGPTHEYVAPATVLAVRFSWSPAQSGLLLPAAGAAGIGFTVTTTVPAEPEHPATVAVTEYVPLAAVVAPAIEGFCTDEVNPLGPLQEYEAPTIALADRLRVLPAQIGELLDAVGAAGIALTVTATIPALPVHPLTVAETAYVPDSAGLAPGMLGFCRLEVNPLGPLQEYVAPAIVLAVKLSVLPSQIGLLLAAVGAAGVAFTTTVTVAGVLAHPLLAITV